MVQNTKDLKKSFVYFHFVNFYSNNEMTCIQFAIHDAFFLSINHTEAKGRAALYLII